MDKQILSYSGTPTLEDDRAELSKMSDPAIPLFDTSSHVWALMCGHTGRT